MRIAHTFLKSVSPYGQSRNYTREISKLDKESAANYEERTWFNRLHTTKDGYVFIPPQSFKSALESAAKYIGAKIPGKKNNTYTKHFEAGVIVPEALVLPIKQSEVHGEWLFLPSDGRPGGGTRVWKCMPRIDEWEGGVDFLIMDETVTPDVFEYHLKQAGQFIGIGFFRPQRRGYWGRFTVENITWENL